MKFNVAIGLAAALSLAPNAAAWALPGFGGRPHATPTAQLSGEPSGTSTGVEPTGVPSGFPKPPGRHHGVGGHRGGRHSPHHFGAVPTIFPSAGGQPSGGFGGDVPTGVPSGFPRSSSASSGGFGGGMPSETPGAGRGEGSRQGDKQFERVHGRQIRPIQV